MWSPEEALGWIEMALKKKKKIKPKSNCSGDMTLAGNSTDRPSPGVSNH